MSNFEQRAERELATVSRIAPLPGIKFVSAGELTKTHTPTQWLIRNILECDSVNTLIGAPASFKSNLALDMAASVATGKPWHGRPVKQGAVFVIAGEGHNGISKRLKAWSIARSTDLTDAPLYISAGSVALLDPLNAAAVSEEVDRLAKLTGVEPALVIIDTLARNFGLGDENSASDIGRFIQNIDTHIRQRFKCAVLIVHHTGVGDQNRARGSSALYAAVDAEMICDRKPQEKDVTLKCRKTKDSPEFSPICFQSNVVELPWLNDDGNHDNSFVMSEHEREVKSDTFVRTSSTSKFGRNERRAYDELVVMYGENRRRLEAAGHDPAGALVTIDQWRQRASLDRKRYPEVSSSLVSRQLIRLDHPHVVLL